MKELEKLRKYIYDKENRIVEFLQELIRSKPVNPVYKLPEDDKSFGESKCQAIIKKKLNDMGLVVEELEPNAGELKSFNGYPGYSETQVFNKRPNILSKISGISPHNNRSIILTGHADVVNVDLAQEHWSTDPWEGVVKNEKVFGRGSVDMLGGIACLVMAIESLLDLNLPLKGDLWFGSVVGEESGGMGMLALSYELMKRKINIDAGIMAEPTESLPSLLCRGVVWGKIIVKGRSGHIEVKQSHWTKGGAVDAIQKARFILDAIDELNREWFDRPEKNHSLLLEPCQVKIAKIKGGQHGASYAEQCEIDFDIPYLPQEADEKGLGTKTKNEFYTYIQEIANADPWLKDHRPEVIWTLEADCAEVDQEHPFTQTLLDSCHTVKTKTHLTGSGFHTDNGWLPRLCNTPIINFGPGNPALAHHNDEQVSISELLDVTLCTAITCLNWCNQSK